MKTKVFEARLGAERAGRKVGIERARRMAEEEREHKALRDAITKSNERLATHAKRQEEKRGFAVRPRSRP